MVWAVVNIYANEVSNNFGDRLLRSGPSVLVLQILGTVDLWLPIEEVSLYRSVERAKIYIQVSGLIPNRSCPKGGQGKSEGGRNTGGNEERREERMGKGAFYIPNVGLPPPPYISICIYFARRRIALTSVYFLLIRCRACICDPPLAALSFLLRRLL